MSPSSASCTRLLAFPFRNGLRGREGSVVIRTRASAREVLDFIDAKTIDWRKTAESSADVIGLVSLLGFALTRLKGRRKDRPIGPFLYGYVLSERSGGADVFLSWRIPLVLVFAC